MMYALFVLVAILSYLIGSINYSIIFSTVFMHTDIRSKGSGNAGSTNMVRNYGMGAGAITLVTDFFKTLVAVLGTHVLFIHTYPDQIKTAVAVSGLFCAVGHCFPVFFSFKGGKGVAVGAMTILAVDYRCFIAVITVFVLLVLIFRYISLGSIMGALTFPISLSFFTDFTSKSEIIALVFASVLAVMVIALHIPNIGRLLTGKETKFMKKH